MSQLRMACEFGRRTLIELVGAVLMYALPCYPQDIQWIRSYSEGMKIARESNRPGLVDFWSEWCIPCIQMDKEVYTDRRLVDAADEFVFIRVDVDSDRATPSRFGVKTVPTRLFLDPRETVLLEVKGLTKADQLLDIMKPIPRSFEPVEETAARENAQQEFSRPAVPPQKNMVESIPSTLSQAIIVHGIGEYVPPKLIVDLPVGDLLQRFPEELMGIDFDQDQEELDFLLEKVGKRVAEFLENMPNTISKEQIRQERLRPDGKVAARVEQTVNYLLLCSSEDARAAWSEDRTDQRGKPVKHKRLEGDSFLTSNYVLECILFAPACQRTSRYRYLGRQSSEPYAHLIAFAQMPELGALPGQFHMNGGTADLFSQGLAWVDPKGYQIIRMRTDLLEPQPQIGLYQQTTEILYDEHRFSGNIQSFWLPREVVVTIGFGGGLYRNTHHYSEYRLFSVESHDKIEPVAGSGVIK